MKEITYFSGCGENRTELGKVNVKARLGLIDLGTVATLIADGVFEGEEYCPYKYDFAFWYWIMHDYTDFDVSIDIDAFMEIVETTDLCMNVRNAINDQQFDNIETSAQELIQRRLNRSEFDNLCADLRAMLKKWEAKLPDSIDPKTTNKLIKKLTSMKLDEQTLARAVVDAYAASPSKGTDLKE